MCLRFNELCRVDSCGVKIGRKIEWAVLGRGQLAFDLLACPGAAWGDVRVGAGVGIWL